jgi:Putative peptidoglycan binding domain
MTDRRAECLTVLVDQVNIIAPGRDVSSDGWIGDESHQTTTSDHNPWVYDDDGTWVVTAQDITDDPAGGMSCQALVDSIVASEDERIKYIIWNCQICSGTDQDNEAWLWRDYTGSNNHTLHAHFSVKSQPEYYDDQHLWSIEMEGAPATVDREEKALPVLQRGDKGPWVQILQRQLIQEGVHVVRVDGDFGPMTELQVMAFQFRNALVVDGVVGPYTWQALKG